MSARRSGAFFRAGSRGAAVHNGKRGAWWISFTTNGKNYRLPTNANTKTEALKLRSAHLSDAERGELRLPKRRGAVTLGALVARYIESAKTRKRSWAKDAELSAHVLAFFGDNKLVHHIGTPEVLKFREWRTSAAHKTAWQWAQKSKDGAVPMVKASTVNRSLSLLRTLMNYAVDHKIISESPVPRKKWTSREEAAEFDPITPEEERLIAAARAGQTDYLAPMIVFLIQTGMRRGEAFALRWEWVRPERRLLRLPAEVCKSKKGRDVPLSAPALAVLAGLPRRSEYVFSQADGSPLRDIKDGWQGALRRAGLRKIRVHDTRHTWATRYMEAGGTVAELMKHGGWSSLRMIERYAHATAAHTYATLDRMSAPSVASHVYGTSDAEDAAERMTKTAISA